MTTQSLPVEDDGHQRIESDTRNSGVPTQRSVQPDYQTVLEFRSWYASKHRERIGAKYRGDGDRLENDIVRKLLRRFSLAKLHKLSDLFLETELWRGCRKQHTISMLLYVLNRGWPESSIPGVRSPRTGQPRETSEADFLELSRRVKKQRDRILRGEDPT